MSRKFDPLVSATDRMAAAALQAERLYAWIVKRNIKRGEALPEEPAWATFQESNAGIYGEIPDGFPGPRSAWVR